MTLLQSVKMQLASAARRVADVSANKRSQRRCYVCHRAGHIAKDCRAGQVGPVEQPSRCSKCTLRGHDAASCRTQCRKCRQTEHIQANCTSGTAVNRRVVVGSTYSLDVTLNGKNVPAVVNSGSERTLMSKATANIIGLIGVQPSSRQVMGPGKEQLIVYRCSTAEMSVRGDSVRFLMR